MAGGPQTVRTNVSPHSTLPDFPSAPQRENGAASATNAPPEPERRPGLEAFEVSAAVRSIASTGTLVSERRDSADSQPSLFSISGARALVTDLIGRLTSSDYRAAMHRAGVISQWETTTDKTRLVDRIDGLGKFLSVKSEPTSRGASVEETVWFLKNLLADTSRFAGPRLAALNALAQHYTIGDKLDVGFAQETARQLLKETDVAVASLMAKKLGKSRDAFVREALFETFGSPSVMVRNAAATALAASLSGASSHEMLDRLRTALRPSLDADPKTLNRRVAALIALSDNLFPVTAHIFAQIIRSPAEPAMLRDLAMDAASGSFNGELRGAILEVARQDVSSQLAPGIVTKARMYAARIEPGIVIEAESGKRIKLGTL